MESAPAYTYGSAFDTINVNNPLRYKQPDFDDSDPAQPRLASRPTLEVDPSDTATDPRQVPEIPNPHCR